LLERLVNVGTYLNRNLCVRLEAKVTQVNDIKGVDLVLSRRFLAFVALTANTAIAGQQTASPDPASSTDMRSVVVASEATLGNEANSSWVDNSHGYVTQKADAVTRWVDNYFGGTEIDQETANSRLRLRIINNLDEREGNEVRFTLGGNLNLPALSRRLDLVFQGDDPTDSINGQDDPSQTAVGLQYQLSDDDPSALSRFDLTMGLSSSGPRPGLKYRYNHQVSPLDTIHFTQRVQYDLGDGAQTSSRLDIDHVLGDNQLLTNFSRLFAGEDSEGLEWSTSVAHIARWTTSADTPSGSREHATMVYAGLSGQTEPTSYVSNYRLGVRYRRQTYRDYLFVELEPSYNWRIDEPGLSREGAWRVELRFEFLFEEGLRRDGEASAMVGRLKAPNVTAPAHLQFADSFQSGHY